MMLYDLSLSTTGQDIRCREDEIDQPSTKTEHDYKTEVHSHDERPNKASQNRNQQSGCHIKIPHRLLLRSLIPFAEIVAVIGCEAFPSTAVIGRLSINGNGR